MPEAESIIKTIQKGPAERAGEIEGVAGDILVRVKLADWDRLGCLVEKLEMKSLKGGPLWIDPGRLVEKVTYLGETLKVIETEEKRRKAVLRSAPPCTEEERVSFFEIALDDLQGLSLLRYSYDRYHGKRTVVPTPFARNTLERLLFDLIGMATPN